MNTFLDLFKKILKQILFCTVDKSDFFIEHYNFNKLNKEFDNPFTVDETFGRVLLNYCT